MRLVIADERCDNLLKNTVSLLQILKRERCNLPPEFTVMLSKDAKQHTLFMPKRSIVGSHEITEFFINYF
jgi:hypothetical protein